MPELPEVETIRRQLEKEIVGARVREATAFFAGRLNVSAKEFASRLTGATVVSVGRRAKLLLLGFSNGWTAVVHLKMTGRMLLVAGETRPWKHAHLALRFTGGRALFFEDVRKFGFLKILKTSDVEKEIFDKEGYGPEPLDPSFTLKRFTMCVTGRPSKNRRRRNTGCAARRADTAEVNSIRSPSA